MTIFDKKKTLEMVRKHREILESFVNVMNTMIAETKEAEVSLIFGELMSGKQSNTSQRNSEHEVKELAGSGKRKLPGLIPITTLNDVDKSYFKKLNKRRRRR